MTLDGFRPRDRDPLRSASPVSDTTSPPPQFAWDWAGWWTLVFVGNLPMPVALGFSVVEREGGAWGLVGALAVLFWVGFALCLFRFRVGRSLVWGGVVFAVCQFFLVIHLFCGAFGMGLWENMGGQSFFSSEGWDHTRTGWQNDPNIAAFCIVLFSAHPLLLLAIVIGLAIRWCRGDYPLWFNRPADQS
jgi:hypothetical protein